MGPTPKQKDFCRAYVKGNNATTAAVEAGYSPRTARQSGSRLLHKSVVREELERLKRFTHQAIHTTIAAAGSEAPNIACCRELRRA